MQQNTALTGEASTSSNPKPTLLGIPAELRKIIFSHVFTSTTLYATRGGFVPSEVQDIDDPDHRPEYPDEVLALSTLPALPHHLHLVCRLFNAEISTSWHSQVTYHFPTTVAFLDLLSQWPAWKIAQVKHIYLVGTPLPLYSYTDIEHACFHTLDVESALPAVPGLRLDTLTIEDMWLQPNGRTIEDDPWALGASFDNVRALLQSSGWKELRYVSGILGLTPKQMRELEDIAQKLRDARSEPGFTYTLGRVRPRLSGLQTHHTGGRIEYHDSEEDREEVRQWYAAHPEEPASGALPNEGLEKDVMMRVMRGVGAEYVQDGSGTDKVVASLLENIGWVESRRRGGYLVDDGLDDPTGLL